MRADIEETIAYWQQHGVKPNEVWKSVTGKAIRPPPTWSAVHDLLDRKARQKTVTRIVDGVSWQEVA